MRVEAPARCLYNTAVTDSDAPADLLGIDPGAGGALAWVSPDGGLIAVVDMPIIEVRGKKRVCAASLAALLTGRPVARVVIEGVGGMPGQGVGSTFAFGYAAGLCEGVATGAGLPVEIVRASVWKRRAGLSADKGVARQMASRLWPAASGEFKRVRDDGRAEAALMAHWAANRAG